MQCPQVADMSDDWFSMGGPARYQSGDTLPPFVPASVLGDPLLTYHACMDRALGACFQPHTSAPSNESRTKDCREPLEHLLDSS